MSGNVITTTARFVAETQGVEKATADLGKLQGAANSTGAGIEHFSKRSQEALQKFAKARADAVAAVPKFVSAGDEKAFVRVQEQNARVLQTVQKEADNLRASLDPVARAQMRLGQEVGKADALLKANAITWEEHGRLVSLATDKAQKHGAAMGAANQNIKLTGNQVQGLGYQLNDIGTMLAMGASPFQIMASQAGQVVQVLGDGPGGVKGSLAAIGSTIASFATRTNLIVGGLTAAGAAAIYFATRSDSSVKSAEQAMEGYKRLVDSLEGSYQRAADAAESYMARASKEGPNIALAEIQGTTAEIRASLAREIENLVGKTQVFKAEWKDLTPAALAAQANIRKLGDDLAAGRMTAAQFREQIALIRINPATPPQIVKIADDLLAGSLNARDLANALGAVGEAAAAASGKTGRLAVPSAQDMTAPFGGASNYMGRLQPEAFDKIRQGLNDQAEEMKDVARAAEEARQKVIDEMKAVADATAERMASYDQSVAAQRLEVSLVGQSEGAAACLPAEMKTVEAAREEARK